MLERTSYTPSCTKAIHVHGTCGILENAHHRECTEVQNPQCSSACDCTCVLTRIDNNPVNNTIMTSGVSDALMLALCILSLSSVQFTQRFQTL